MNRKLKRKTLRSINIVIAHGVVISLSFVMMIGIKANGSSDEKIEFSTDTVQETFSEEPNEEIIIIEDETEETTEDTTEDTVEETEEVNTEQSTECGDTYTEYERYLLAKIAMAEAEGEDLKGKALVVKVVLNRVDSFLFPDTIEDVIFQKNQFSPILDGRWDKVEPSQDCWEAVDMVLNNGWDESNGALYFKSGGSSSKWHEENLQYLFKHGNHSFFTEKG